MSEMTIRASRGARLLVAAALAWLGLAMYAQAAHATYSKITIVKINQGGDQNDTFTFHPSLNPAATDFSIKAGESSRKTFQVECNVRTECIQRWGDSTQTVSEVAKTGYTLSAIDCRHTGGAYGDHDFHAEPTMSDPADGDTTVNLGTGKVDFKLAWGEWVKCWFTNTKNPPPGTIKVTKSLVPASDSGRFNLLIDGATKAANVGDGGTTGVVTVPAGTHTVGESAGTGTSLGDYTSSLACKDTAHGNATDNDGTLQVGYGDAWECVITNTRKTQPPPPVEPPTPTPPTAPRIHVSPERVRTGIAKLSGPSGCPRTGTVAATVSGRRIVKVTFYVDGKKVKTLTKANGKGGTWVLPLNIKRLAYGAHRVRASVQFAKSSQTKVKTLRFSFDRCHAAAAQPKFTG
jgi:Prealbumin-like fold domain